MGKCKHEVEPDVERRYWCGDGERLTDETAQELLGWFEHDAAMGHEIVLTDPGTLRDAFRELITHRKLNTLLHQLASQWRSSGRVEPGLMDVIAEMVRNG